MDVAFKSADLRDLFVFLLLPFISACGNIGFDQGAQQVFPESSVSCASTAVKGQFVVRWVDGHTTVEKGDSREQFIAEFVKPHLLELTHVEYDQYIQPLSLHSSRANPVQAIVTPPPPVAPINWGVQAIQAPVAWNKGVLGDGIIAAVVDTGVDINHPQLKNQIFVNLAEFNGKPGVDDDSNGYVDDINGWNFVSNSPVQNDTVGHGTHVSGIIAADSTMGVVQGVAPKTKILPVQFMNDLGGTSGNAILGIEYAASMGARVINASWSSSQCSPNLQAAIAALEPQNVIFAAAAGNSFSDLSQFPEFPAALSLPIQITVGASSIEFVRPSFSNYGKLVQVVAPGQDIYSTFKNSKYAYLDGTSMATPFVVGEAALLMSARPDLPASAIRNAIFKNVAAGNFSVLYNGEIRVGAALSYLQSLH